jgi:hypothetical protein
MTGVVWTGSSVEGDSWKVEVEVDCFNAEDGRCVSLWVENTPAPDDSDERPVQALVMASAEQAREMADVLLRCADAITPPASREEQA